ncbi:MAG: glycosyltransferase family 87 protein [Terriglobales bacterium]
MRSTSAIRRLRPLPRLGLLVFCLISIGVSGRQMLWYFSHGPTVTDLRIFMTGIDMVASGQGRQLYHFDAQQKAQIQLYPETRTSGLLPFNHLAYELLFYWPVSKLPYRTALLVWALANVAILFLIARLLAPYSRALTQATGTPLALYLLAFYPVMYVFGEGQDSLIFMLLVVLSLRSMDSGRTFLAGFLLALACFKFHLALLIAFFVLLLRGKWQFRRLAGFATGAALVGGISLALVGPAILHDYPAMLRQQDVMTPWGFIPWFMPNLRGLLQWALAPRLDAGTILPVVFMSSAVVGVVAIWQTLRNRNSNNEENAKNIAKNINDESMAYAVAILTTILISYHLHMQDLTMALLPIVVLADRAIRMWQERRTTEKPNLWIALLAVTIATLYLYRIAAEPFPVLLLRGCLLAVPVFVLWVVALRWWSTPTPP